MYGEKVSIRIDVIFPDEEGGGRGIGKHRGDRRWCVSKLQVSPINR